MIAGIKVEEEIIRDLERSEGGQRDLDYRREPRQVGWRIFFNKRSYDYTVLHPRLYQTETHVSRPVFGKVGERVIEGPEMIEVTNIKVAVAKEKLKEARTRQKSYADKHRRSLEFQ
nr:putative nucleotidyltransferase, ribonuclease H [Tanacetum cinerariifolium]